MRGPGREPSCDQGRSPRVTRPRIKSGDASPQSKTNRTGYGDYSL